MDENEIRERSLVIPLIYIVFFLCVTTGGVLLILYVFFPNLSQPWFLFAALALIGTTWIFWLLTYLYSWIKLFLRRHSATYNGGSAGNQLAAKQDSP